MIKPGEIQKKANQSGLRDRQIEKDYIITWILFGISQNKLIFNNLIFKGGTALKKAYFPGYRFSEDMDFTLDTDRISNEILFSEFDKIFELIKEEANITLEIKDVQEYKSRESLNFHINYLGPLGGALGNKDLKIDITRDEVLEFETVDRRIFTEYSDIIEHEFKIKCYQLSEILIEKMTALLGRAIPRDLYDLWYLVKYERMNLKDYYYEFERKAKNKKYKPEEFPGKVLIKEQIFKRDWDNNLRYQIRELPDFNEVMRDLKKQFRKLL
jgi:predicted nucleotidyltransferase component of viral defense system